MKYEIVETAVSDIMPGDTVLHNGVLMTVCANNIKRGFMGTTIFGDSYRSGRTMVKKALIFQARP